MATKKRRIAQISDATIGRRRTVALLEDGTEVTEKIPTLEGFKMMNRDGMEFHVSLQPHRVPSKEGFEKYGQKHLREMIREGMIPKDVCPLTIRYGEYVKGSQLSLVPNPKNEKECDTVALREAAAEKGEEWHGCKHYRKAKEARRARCAKKAQIRRERGKNGPADDAMKLLRQTVKTNADLASIAASKRRDIEKGDDLKDEKGR